MQSVDASRVKASGAAAAARGGDRCGLVCELLIGGGDRDLSVVGMPKVCMTNIHAIRPGRPQHSAGHSTADESRLSCTLHTNHAALQHSIFHLSKLTSSMLASGFKSMTCCVHWLLGNRRSLQVPSRTSDVRPRCSHRLSEPCSLVFVVQGCGKPNIAAV